MKIFISSVQKEFAAERKALAKMIREDRWLGGFFDVFLFEECTAKAKTPQKVYLDAVAESDIYINPGSLPKGTTVDDLLISHDSNPRNHVIARAMSWTNYVEKSGSGTGEIIRLCREAGLADPVFESMTGHFKTTIWRLGYGKGLVKGPVQGSSARAQCKGPSDRPKSVGPSDRPKSMGPSGRPKCDVASRQGESSIQERVIAALFNSELKSSELAAAVGNTSLSGWLKRCVVTMIGDGLIERTIKAKPRSQHQRYRLTDKGRSLAAQLSKKKGGRK